MSLRSIAVAAFGPATLFGLAEGSMIPVIVLSSIDRGAITAIAAHRAPALTLVAMLVGFGNGGLPVARGSARRVSRPVTPSRRRTDQIAVQVRTMIHIETFEVARLTRQ